MGVLEGIGVCGVSEGIGVGLDAGTTVGMSDGWAFLICLKAGICPGFALFLGAGDGLVGAVFAGGGTVVVLGLIVSGTLVGGGVDGGGGAIVASGVGVGGGDAVCAGDWLGFGGEVGAGV